MPSGSLLALADTTHHVRTTGRKQTVGTFPAEAAASDGDIALMLFLAGEDAARRKRG